jgi:cobalt-zinc-cadmium efflux system membrane fusion protein
MMARITLGLGLVLAGAAGMYVFLDRSSHEPDTGASRQAPPAATAEPPADSQTLVLTAEAVSRAGISVSPVTMSTDGSALRVPGVVEPDAYRTVEVTPIVSGTVLSVSAVLGEAIVKGATVARLRSPELTDEARRWLTGRAALDAVSRRQERTRQLAKIGAASQEELEAIQAEFVQASTEVDTARARLARLGLDDAGLAAIAAGEAAPEVIDVRAPAGGVVVRRAANPGQNVAEADSLLTLADVRHVWVMADVFERDLGPVRIGQTVTVTSEAFTGRTWTGRVAYIDPELARDTRTARVRIEVDNPDAALRFGMFAVATISAPAAVPSARVPKASVQTLGAVSVVYVEVPGQPHTFVERAVVLGNSSGDQVEIRSGVSPGDRVVGTGSFFLRAERDRLGWPLPVAPAPAREVEAPETAVARRVIEITATGLSPARLTVPAHQPVDLVFIRRVEETCGTDVLIPALGIRRALPLNQRVTIRLPARDPGELAFSCGMDMLRGVIVVTDGGG